MAANDTADLLSRLRVRAALPNLTTVLTNAQTLRLFDDELLGFVAPLLKAQQQSFFQASETQALVAGTANYRVPARAMGGTVHQVLLVDANGQEWPLDLLPSEQVATWRASQMDRGTPRFYFFEGATLSLVPVPDSSAQSIRLIHERRPNRLVTTGECSVITNITGTAVTVAAAGSGFGTASAAYDFISRLSPHDSLAVDQSATRSGTTMTFAVAPPSTVAVGDYVALAQESCFPQIPDDLVPLLIDRAVAVILPLLGDTELGAGAGQKAAQSAQVASGLVSPRAGGEVKKIPGGHSVLGRHTRWPR